jgi:hypothetical protein
MLDSDTGDPEAKTLEHQGETVSEVSFPSRVWRTGIPTTDLVLR